MRKIHYNVMRSSAMMTFEQADVLAGRAKSTSAQFYVAYELDKMAEAYKEAWQSSAATSTKKDKDLKI
jgi:hypothetical protein